MGCDIHLYVEVKVGNKWSGDCPSIFDNGYGGVPRVSDTPFDWRSYGMFAFFTHTVRNYSAVPPVFTDKPRGIPADSSFARENRSLEYGGWDYYDDYVYGDNHSHSYLTLRELAEFDYDQKFEDCRVTRQTGPNSWDGGCTAEPGGGEMTTYREFLGEKFFEHLEALKTVGDLDDVRIVFWFDN